MPHLFLFAVLTLQRSAQTLKYSFGRLMVDLFGAPLYNKLQKDIQPYNNQVYQSTKKCEYKLYR